MKLLIRNLPERFDAHDFITRPCNARALRRAFDQYADEVWWKIAPKIMEAMLDGEPADLSEHSADFLKYLEEEWKAGNL